MSNNSNNAVEKSSKGLVQTKRIRSRNSYDTINQIMESYNKSEGWALKKVSMIGMNIDVVVERSSLQGDNKAKETPSAKQVKEEVAKTSEPQTESKEVVVDVDDTDVEKESPTKPTAKRGRATTKK